MAALQALASFALVTVALGPIQARSGVTENLCPSRWVLDRPPSVPGVFYNNLTRAAVVGPDDTWAVGYYGGPGADDAYGPLTLHWDGSTWKNVPAPDPGPGTDALRAVDGVGPENVWAVGATERQQAFHPLTLHWDGTGWSNVPVPGPPDGGEGILTSVVTVGPDDVWALGLAYELGGFDVSTLIEHWDGSAWTIVTSPNPGDRSNYILDAETLPTGEVWAVGKAFDEGGAGRPFSLRRGGSSWEKVATLPDGPVGGFNGIGNAPTSGLWAVGEQVRAGTGLQTMVARWDGADWSLTASPNSSRDGDDSLWDVVGVSTNTAWAVGFFAPDVGQVQPLVIGWDGVGWTTPSLPKPKLRGELLGVAATPEGEVWAVGWRDVPDGPNDPLILHRCAEL